MSQVPDEWQRSEGQPHRDRVERLLSAVGLSSDDWKLVADLLRDKHGTIIRAPYNAGSISAAQAGRDDGWLELLALVEYEDALFRPRGAAAQELAAARELEDFLRGVADPKTALEYFRAKLLEAAQGHDHGNFPIAYLRAMEDVNKRPGQGLEGLGEEPEEPGREPGTFSGCVEQLLGMETDQLEACVRFVEWYCRFLGEIDQRFELRASLRMACDELIELLKPIDGDLAAKLGGLREEIEGRDLERRPHILFRIEGKALGGYSAWRYPGGWSPDAAGYPVMLRNSDDPVETLEQLREAVQEVIGSQLELSRREGAKPPVIEFMGEWKWLDSADKIEVRPTTDSDSEETLGRLAPVVIRLPDCHADANHYRRWRNVHTANGALPIQYLKKKEDHDQHIDDDCGALAFCYPLNDICATLRQVRKDFGIRIAAWSRRDGDWSRRDDDIKGVVRGRSMYELIYEIWARRRGPGGDAHDLVLLWDDPHWFVEDNRLEWRSA